MLANIIKDELGLLFTRDT